MKNVSIRNKLLAADDSSLQDVIKAAQTAEVAEATAAELKSNDKLTTVCKIAEAPCAPVSHPHDYNSSDFDTYEDHCCQLRGPPARQPRPPFQACAGCRGQHPRSRCPFKDAFCRRCDKRGHIAAVCRATLPDDILCNQDLLPTFPAQRSYRPFRQQGRGNRRPWNNRGSYTRPGRTQEQIDWDLPGFSDHSSAAPALPCSSRGNSAPTGSEEPSSSVDTQALNEPRRSERTPRRPAHLDDFITCLSE